MRRPNSAAWRRSRIDPSIRHEALIAGLLLALAIALRCALAASGWPAVESDEATMGLMADDILWHGAHPIFFYGQHYLGAFQAYLAAPIFATLGPTNLALHVVTTLEILLFLLILYLLTRAVFSRAVALWTLLLLALGPYEGLDLELHAGAGAQETLVFGAALLALAYLRLTAELHRRNAARAAGRELFIPVKALLPALDVSLGAVAGLGLWAHLLTAPFIATAILALAGFRVTQALWPRPADQRASPVAMGMEHLVLSSEETSARLAALSPAHRLRGTTASPPAEASRDFEWPRLRAEVAAALRQVALFALGFLVAAFPFVWANIASHGATFKETFGIAGAGATGHPGLIGHALALGQQLLATLLIGLPHLLNGTLLCPTCVEWPRPQAVISGGALAHEAAVALPLSLFVIALWLINALALARVAWRAALRRRATARLAHAPAPRHGQTTNPFEDAGWWGRALFVVGAALVLLEYVLSRASYATPVTSARYLIGLYVFTPLVVAPLVSWSQPLWTRWSNRQWFRRSYHEHADETARARLAGAWLSAALLIALALLNLAGAITSLRLAQNRSLYAVPATATDLHVTEFLLTRHATRFYTTYWVCNRLMFVAQERLTCAVISDQNAFQSGANRIASAQATLAATAHPAYVFFSGDAHAAPTLPAQVRNAIAVGDPRFNGYASATVAGYQIFYYAGPAGGGA